jgi:phage baseplate assembly protein W
MASSIITALKTGYKDLDLAFKTHPLYGDVRPVINVDAVKNSVKNIILTTPGEKPFDPTFGCSLRKYLFEPADAITKSLIRQEIEYSLQLHEPRIRVNEIIISEQPDNNTLAITLDITVVNTQQNVDLTIILERLR